ncbi:MAG: hypothetical protein RXN89_01785 [Vulcanisaeta sp.]|nr:MAG: hypothetical protein AT718_07835 [Vulcanisaeta sp. JCHS_4]KUO93193.1 MAG: hypothetical protein AT717_04220 [Vulcanisaeta sp. CIS_19]MCG2865324.1 hypothetical protein [Vulcanisaeta sp.]PVU73027.1 hypothetical protein DDW08_00460 [Vulcanisaeta sp. SCGC AB-777_J10]MCG2885910.1 hypothetical protein [Vulcanisaeta sp.]
MNPYVIGAFINECRIRWRSIEGFSDAVDYIKSVEPGVVVTKDIISAPTNVCDEVAKLLQRPGRLLTLLNVGDWLLLIRGLYDFNGELIDPEPNLDMPNLVLNIKVPSRSLGLVIRVVLKFLDIGSSVFSSDDGRTYVVVHDRDSIARFIKTIKPHLDPEQNIVLKNKWAKHYAPYGNPIILLHNANR